jgi:hypothetical protein
MICSPFGQMHRCERNKKQHFATFHCKILQFSAEQFGANRSRLKHFAGVCRSLKENRCGYGGPLDGTDRS